MNITLIETVEHISFWCAGEAGRIDSYITVIEHEHTELTVELIHVKMQLLHIAPDTTGFHVDGHILCR